MSLIMVHTIHNMAESKASGFSRVVQKHSLRAKERILQNFGKADKTTDELFEVYQNNFNKQQNSALRLQKELKNYTSCMREMQIASKNLMECLTEIYEQEWPGHEQIPLKAQTLELLWEDLCHNVNDQVTIPLSTYLSQFSEIRNKIAKRGRKLVDYDGSRHNVEAQQTTKKRDDIKVAKAKEQMEEARRLYEVLNKELHDELPALYDSRIPFLISSLQTLFSSETTFHREYSNVHAQFAEIVDALAAEAAKGSYLTNARHVPMRSSPNSSLKQDGVVVRPYEEIDFKQRSLDKRSPVESNRLSSPQANGGFSSHGTDTTVQFGHSPKNEHRDSSLAKTENSLTNEVNNRESDKRDTEVVNLTNDKQKMDELYDIPIGATTTDLPPGVLYKVRATYKYAAEDADELSFETNEIIHVIEYEDPEEQEEGWLMGMRETNGEKGLFPANFTRPI